ncbi:hypothetical protein Tco_1052584 [Tanacetum coccineum]
MNHEITSVPSKTLTPREITNLFHREDLILNIKTYFRNYSQSQPSKPRPRYFSFEEWLKLKLGNTNMSNSVRNVVLNEWVLDSFDIEADYGKTRDDPYSRRFDEYKKAFDNEIGHLGNEYDLRIGKKVYILDDVWEKCEKIHGGTLYPWHDEGFEEEEQWIFVCITKQLDDALPLGRGNGFRFMGMIRKEMDGDGGREM